MLLLIEINKIASIFVYKVIFFHAMPKSIQINWVKRDVSKVQSLFTTHIYEHLYSPK